MKYELEIEIGRPREEVVKLFDDRDRFKEWQPSLVEFRHLSGEPGQPGAKAELVHKMGKRNVTMLETVTDRNLPHSFSGTYEVSNCYNTVENVFEELSPGTTKWTFRTEFTFRGFMKIMAFLMPGAFKKESWKHMVNFKEFAEGDAGRNGSESA